MLLITHDRGLSVSSCLYISLLTDCESYRSKRICYKTQQEKLLLKRVVYPPTLVTEWKSFMCRGAKIGEGGGGVEVLCAKLLLEGCLELPTYIYIYISY